MALLGTREAESDPVHTRILADMDFIDKFGRGVGAGDTTAFCSIMITRSLKHLVELSNEFHKCHGRPIREIVEKKFTGHMRDGLLFIAKGIEHMGDAVERDAEYLIAAMKGMGTKDQWLIWRCVQSSASRGEP
jgi:annexin A7/11